MKRLGEVTIASVENNFFVEDCKEYDLAVMKAFSALIKMCNILPSPGTEQDPETRARIYLDIMKNELSPDSITKVCSKVLAGYVGDPKWLPAPGVLIRYAKENWIQLVPVESDPRFDSPKMAPPEHKWLGRDYSDEQFRADERARVAKQLKAFASELRTRNAELCSEEGPDYTRRGPPIYSKKGLSAMDVGEREKQRIAAEEWLVDALKENRANPVKLSKELCEKLACGMQEVAAE